MAVISQRDEFIRALRSQTNVRWQHQGRLKGVALDCAGLIVVAAREVGLDVKDVTTYDRRPNTYVLQGQIDATGLTHVGKYEPLQVGDLLVMAYDNNPQHLAIITTIEEGRPPMIIHGSAKERKTVEHYLSSDWHDKIVQVWRFPFSE